MFQGSTEWKAVYGSGFDSLFNAIQERGFGSHAGYVITKWLAAKYRT